MASDKDIRSSLFLLANMATILNRMKTDMHKKAQRKTNRHANEFEFHSYSDKMIDY